MSNLADVILGNPDDTARVPTLRQGIVTATAPLSVLVGAATTSRACRTLASYVPTIGDVVSVLVIAGDRLVLGRADTTGGGGGSVDPTQFVKKTGDTMTGRLFVNVGNAPALSMVGTGVHLELFTDGQAARTGYLQGNGGSGLILNSEAGPLDLASGSGYVMFPASVRVGVPTAYGGTYGGLSWSNGQYLIMSDGANTFVTAPGNGFTSIRGGTNGTYQLNINGNGQHECVGHLGFGGHNINGLNSLQGGGYIASSQGGGQWYHQRAFQCNNNGSRVGYSMLPGGYAAQMDMLYNSPNINFLNTDGGAYTSCYAATFVDACRREYKQDLEAWPAQPASAGAMAATVRSAWDRVRGVEVVSYRKRPEQMMRVTMGVRRDKARVRLDAWRARKGLEPWPAPAHLCGSPDRDDYDCGHTLDEPCGVYRAWQRGMIGAVAEQLEEVLPEAVGWDMTDDQPAGVNLGAMIFAVVRALQDLPADLPGIGGKLDAITDRLDHLEHYYLRGAA